MMFPIKNRTFEQILGFSISKVCHFSPRATVKASINKIALFSNFRPAALYGLQIMIHDIIGFVQDILLCG